MGGVGPMVASSPRPLNDPSMMRVQAIEIHQYPQNPSIWSNMEAMNAQSGLSQPQHVTQPLQPTLQQSTPYAQMVFMSS